MGLVDHFRMMQRYEEWANRATLDSIDSVPSNARTGVQYTRALQVMAHNQLARSVWLARVEGRAEKPADWFPAWSAADTRAKAAELDAKWNAFLANLSEEDVARSISYASSEGIGYTSTLGEILAHVYNHSTYHRGQIARLVSEAGGRRATTDLIAMNRRPA